MRALKKRDPGICWITEQAGASFDPGLTGIGGSPWSGDMGALGVLVPAEPTTLPNNRYLIRLCGIAVDDEHAIVVRGLRQYASLRADSTYGSVTLPLEREIESPGFRFADGNISWHLRFQQKYFAARTVDPNQMAGTAVDLNNLDAALLYAGPGGLVPYHTPAGGRPPGVAIGDLGTFHDIRFPWNATDWSMSEILPGPGAVVFYASVYQTDPSIRLIDGGSLYPNLDGMREEDRFVASFVSSARFGRVAGAIVYEIVACPKEHE